MQREHRRVFKVVLLAALVAGAANVCRVAAADSALQTSCVACHTNEKALSENLSTEEQKKSALTSGAG